MIEREIDGLQVTGQALPEYPRGGALLAELLDIAAPAIGAILPSVQGSKVELSDAAALGALLGKLDAGAVLAAIGQALGRLGDGPRFTRVTGQLLGCLTVEMDEGGKVTKIDLNSEAKIARVVRAGASPYLRLGKLLLFALEVNFGGFFGGGLPRPSTAAAESQFREG